ncbi:MAG: cell division protein SepF [Candidatus Hadarchaeales archaeon]
MKAFRRIFGGNSPPAPAPEVPVMEVNVKSAKPTAEIEPIYVKSMEMRSLLDVQEIAEELRSGNIMIIEIGALMNQNPEELKRAIDQIKGICQAIGGSVGRLTDSKVIATPRFVSIEFKKAS